MATAVVEIVLEIVVGDESTMAPPPARIDAANNAGGRYCDVIGTRQFSDRQTKRSLVFPPMRMAPLSLNDQVRQGLTRYPVK
jgi:hypothetical protein